MVQKGTIVEQLGPEAVQKPNPADVEHLDTMHSCKCEWKSTRPPRWGSPADATISVVVRVQMTEDGDPDVGSAKGGYQSSASGKEITDSPPDVIGDVSRHRFEPAKPGSQIVTVDFRRANAHVTVEYSGIGWNRRDSIEHYIPQAEHEAATREIARQVNAALGEPK